MRTDAVAAPGEGVSVGLFGVCAAQVVPVRVEVPVLAADGDQGHP